MGQGGLPNFHGAVAAGHFALVQECRHARILGTDRLLLRQFDRRDADLLVELGGDPTWAALQVCGLFLRQPDQAKLVLHRAGRPIVLRQLAGPDPVCIGEKLAE